VATPARTGGDEPLVLFRRWYARARRAGIPLPDAMALATVDARGRPAVRFVLLKSADPDGFVFFTDARSPKGRDLRANRRAAAVFYWHPIGKQVRIAGPVEEVTAAEADAYWHTRPRASRLAALASSQSAALAARADLLTRWRELRATHRGRPISRPRDWTGFRMRPDEIEFWTRGAHRLHRRERYRRRAKRWVRTLLQP
jgi:pyridoxamine 5'-phosphate oxidase